MSSFLRESAIFDVPEGLPAYGQQTSISCEEIIIIRWPKAFGKMAEFWGGPKIGGTEVVRHRIGGPSLRSHILELRFSGGSSLG